MSRIAPAGEPGRYVRSFECPKCAASFDTTDASDAEIEEFAKRMIHTKGTGL
jgi:hypothetical protein